MWGFGSILALVLALLLPGPAFAAEPDDSAAWYASTSPTPGEGIKAMVTGLRQSVEETGLSQAINKAGDWVKELELTWTAHRATDATADSDGGDDAAAPAEKTAVLTAVDHGLSANPPPAHAGWGPVSIISNSGGEHGWAMDHAQPPLAVMMDSAAGGGHTGSASAENALASHDLQLGLRVPFLPWGGQLAADHYWWGSPAFGPTVAGTRVGLRFTPVENVEIEGGRKQDQRGAGGFVGLNYRLPLDQPN
jgi:hypothetical protein